MSRSSQIYLFNTNCNIDRSTMVTRHLKICVSFADKYIMHLLELIRSARGVNVTTPTLEAKLHVEGDMHLLR